MSTAHAAAASAVGPTEPRLHPEQLGPYRISGLIAQGSTSLVFAGEDEQGRTVAIKLAIGLDADGRRRFRREIEACRRLRHPGIVRIRAAGEHQGRPWYAMDHQGEISLRELIDSHGIGISADLPELIADIRSGRSSPVPPDQRRPLARSAALNVVRLMARAIAHAHARGLVHRDLKPENVLLRPDGTPVIADFGLVVDLDERRRLTHTNQVLGTVGYLAPEQLSGRRDVDERVDIYALGVILGELLAGVPPLGWHLAGQIGLPVDGGRAVLRRLELPARQVVARATHRDRHRRYHAIEAFAADIQRLLHGEPVRARPDPLRHRVMDWAGRHARPLAVLGLLALLAALPSTFVWLTGRIEAASWAMPVVSLDPGRRDDLQRLRILAGQWRAQGGALVPQGSDDALLALPVPITGAARLRAVLQVGALGEQGVSLLLAADEKLVGGYRLQLGARGNALALLWRQEELLWSGPLALESGRSVVIELERHGQTLRARLDGRQLCSVQDLVPLRGGWAGVSLPAGGVQPAALRQLELTPAAAVDLVDDLDGLRLLLAQVEALPAKERPLIWPALRAELHAIQEGAEDEWRRDELARLRRQAKLLLGESVQGEAHRQALIALLAQEPEAQRDWRWHATRLQAAWPQGELDASLLEALLVAWRARPEQRVDLARWWLRLAERDPARLLAPLVESLRRYPVDDVVHWLLVERVLIDLPWSPAARAWAIDALAGPAARPPGAVLADRGRLYRVLLERLGEERPLALGPARTLMRRQARQSWAGTLRLALGEREGPVDEDIELILRLSGGHDPLVRLDARLIGLDRLHPAERRWLALVAEQSLPAPTSWDLLCEPLELHRQLRELMRHPERAGAWALSLAAQGQGPEELPWHRIFAAALLLRPDDVALRRHLLLLLPDLGLDALVVSQVWHWSQQRPLPTALRASLSPEMANVLGGLEAPSARHSVPKWHPSRPLLELLLAVAAERAGDLSQARSRAMALAEQRRWPEGAAAAVLMERLE